MTRLAGSPIGASPCQWSNPFALELKDQSQLQAGRATVQLGLATGAKTERELAYIAADAALNANFENTPQRLRLMAYRDELGALSARYPADHEGHIFYALAIAASEDPADKTYAGRLKAGAILDQLFQLEPNHPG